jgi:hypothetical protein
MCQAVSSIQRLPLIPIMSICRNYLNNRSTYIYKYFNTLTICFDKSDQIPGISNGKTIYVYDANRRKIHKRIWRRNWWSGQSIQTWHFILFVFVLILKFLLFTKFYHLSSTCEAGTIFGLKRHNVETSLFSVTLRYVAQHLAFSWVVMYLCVMGIDCFYDLSIGLINYLDSVVKFVFRSIIFVA